MNILKIIIIIQIKKLMRKIIKMVLIILKKEKWILQW